MTQQFAVRSIAIVVPALRTGGGVPTFAAFLYRALERSGRYAPTFISLATATHDQYSVQLLNPTTWLRGPRIQSGQWHGKPFLHIGAVMSDFEFRRYQPHMRLTNLLNQFDLVQVVAGSPAWAFTTAHVQRPVCLFTATLVGHERVARARHLKGWRKHWLIAMTSMAGRIEQQALAHIDCVFAESEYTHRILRPVVNDERLLLGVPGVDTDFFCPGTYCSDGYILSVGRFSDPRKNVRLLFAAYHQLRQLLPCVPQLVLAGKQTPSTRDWEYAVALGIAEYIQVYTGVSSEQLRDLYQKAALFVLSSDEEGLGIVILEAMASGLPVISTRCGGPETAILEGETGVLTPIGNAEAMAVAMQYLLDNLTLRQKMGQAGRQRAETRFSISAAGQIYLEQYDRLLTVPTEAVVMEI